MDYKNEFHEEVGDDLNDHHVEHIELVDDGIVMSGGELEFKSPSPKAAVVEDEGEDEDGKMTVEEGYRKTEVIPFYEGSIGSSCGSQRSKLRLCLEMNIKSKLTGRDIPEENARTDPVMVVVDYPDDVVVTVNAKIQRLEGGGDMISPVSSDIVDDMNHLKRNDHDNEVVTGQNEANGTRNSTFVKVPLSSTLIYPIIEEPESSARSQSFEDDEKVVAGNLTAGIGKSMIKSGSGDGSLYQTVMGDAGANTDEATGFGDISAINKMDVENREKTATRDVTPIIKVNLSKHLSQKLNSSSKLFTSERITPGEKLLKALHLLAKYHGVWGIYEDETWIVKYVLDLNTVLTTTDNATVYNICKEEDFLEVQGLISYFTLEKRFIIRSELLQTFTILSQKSPIIFSFILASDVPIVLLEEVANGDFAKRETYAYASYLLQMLKGMTLSEEQCNNISKEVYGLLIGMMSNAEKKFYKAEAELLLEILLWFHKLLGESDLKWQSLDLAAENQVNMKKMKQKLTNFLLRSVSLSPRSVNGQEEGSGAENRISEILIVINDLIVCRATRELFSDAELDLILVTLIHNLENNNFAEFKREAVKTIHRILLTIRTEPSGMDKLERLVIKLLELQHAGGGDFDRCYRTVLKKIYKILSIS